MFLKSSVSLKQEIKCSRIIDFIRILYTVVGFSYKGKLVSLMTFSKAKPYRKNKSEYEIIFERVIPRIYDGGTMAFEMKID